MTKATDDLEGVPRPSPGMDGTRSTDREIELEERVRKLETALAERPAPEVIEDGVADRVIAKLSATPGQTHPLAGSDRVLVLASTTDVPAPPKGAVLHPSGLPNDPTRRTWFLTQLVGEIRLAIRMYFDPRYRISRTTQFGIPGIAVLLVFNYFFFTVLFHVTIVSPILERLLAVLLVVVGYKILTRELGRYREVLEYLARYGNR